MRKNYPGYSIALGIGLLFPASYSYPQPIQVPVAATSVEHERSLEEAVIEGYKSFGELTSGDIELAKELMKDDVAIVTMLDAVTPLVEKIKSSGSLNYADRSALPLAVINNIERRLPEKWKPENPESALDLAMRLTGNYHGIVPDADLLVSAGVTEINLNGKRRLISSGDYSFTIDINYNPRNPARSVLIFAHELDHAFQKELHVRIRSSLDRLAELLTTDGMKSVRLTKELVETAKSDRRTSNILHFYQRPEVFDLMRTYSADTADLESFLRENTTTLDMVDALYEGIAYLAEREIVRAFPEFDERTRVIYSVIAGMDVLDVLIHNRDVSKVVLGVGIVQHLKDRGLLEDAVKSPEKVEEILRRK